MQKRLSELKDMETAFIAGFTNYTLGSKLLKMGFLPESEVCIVRRAPFKGGFYIKVNSHNFALRYEEVEGILVKTKQDKS